MRGEVEHQVLHVQPVLPNHKLELITNVHIFQEWNCGFVLLQQNNVPLVQLESPDPLVPDLVQLGASLEHVQPLLHSRGLSKGI